MKTHELITFLRKEHGLSLEQLGAKVGISKQALDSIEKGANSEYLERVINLFKALGYDFTPLPMPDKATNPPDIKVIEQPVRSAPDVDTPLKDNLPARWKQASKPEPLKATPEQLAKLKALAKGK